MLAIVLFSGCNNKPKKKNELPESYKKGTFGYDLNFLKSKKDIVVLKSDQGNSMVMVCPAWQGRVMTSTFAGDTGRSLGWINYKLIDSGITEKHINAYGGEDRFWLGPEGGQFSIYFKPGMPFVFNNWNVPKEIDTEPFDLTDKNETWVKFFKTISLVNYSNIRFDLNVERTVELLDRSEVTDILGTPVNGLDFVAYKSTNTITNIGKTPWTKEKGMLSVWILGMFQPSPSTTILIPFKANTEADSGPEVNDSYFGKIPGDRLKIKDNVLFFKADGKQRGKLGLGPKRVMPYIGAYDKEENILTIVNFSLPKGATDYVNSMWELQKEPFSGDVANSYNDGPLGDGSQLGPFFELESSSPAAALAPGSSLTHTHITMHLTGSTDKLDEIARRVFKVSLEEINSAF